MIKDLVVNLALEVERDPVAAFALSLANTFAAHAAGIAFQYDPIMPTALMDDVPPDVIDTQRAENERAANVATSRFDGAARVASVHSEAPIFQASMAGAPTCFAPNPRRFDPPIAAQGRAGADGPEALIVEQALFD